MGAFLSGKPSSSNHLKERMFRFGEEKNTRSPIPRLRMKAHVRCVARLFTTRPASPQDSLRGMALLSRPLKLREILSRDDSDIEAVSCL